MIEVPAGSIYLGMYTQGLKGVSLFELSRALQSAGKQVRQKDIDNYYRGYYKRELYHGSYVDSMLALETEKKINPFYEMKYSDYPENPFNGLPEINNRYVPCNANGRPIIKWSKGCMSRVDAECMLACESLAENLKGTKFIVVDVDGDHNDEEHLDTILKFRTYIRKTHCLYKPNKLIKHNGIAYPMSYHLTFAVNRIIPTMHFNKAHIDIVGNKMNSLRYFKNKRWNNVAPLEMTDEVGNDIKERIKALEE